MPNAKEIIFDWSESSITVYCIIRREVDRFYLDGFDGSFVVDPLNPHLLLAEDAVIKGRYELLESRQAWNNGRYTSAIYRQSGASPEPSKDTIIGSTEMEIEDDKEVTLLKILLQGIITLGLSQHNFRLYDIEYRGNQRSSAKKKIYPSAEDTINDTNAIITEQIDTEYDNKGILKEFRVTEL